MPVRKGTGATLALGTTDYDIQIMSLSQGDSTVPVIDTTHLGTTVARTKIFGDLIDWGEMEIEFHLDPDKLDTLDSAFGVDQQATLTFPTVTGETSGATIVGNGAITSHNFSVPLEDKIVGNYTWTWSGDLTFADAT